MLFPMPTLAERYYNNEGKKKDLSLFFSFCRKYSISSLETQLVCKFFGAWTWQLNLKKIKS